MTDGQERRHGPDPSDLKALMDGAATLTQAGNRIAALSLLWSAVAIDPLDLGAHRHLAATLANAGDLGGAADEFARYIEFVVPLGDIGRATLELQYGVNMLGGQPALRDAAQKIADAVLALVPATDAVLMSTTAPVALTPPAKGTIAARAASFPAPRLLPKVPFRFCLHPGGDRHWMQLEGGLPGMVPDAVRVIDRWDNVVDERLTMPLRAGESHAPNPTAEAPALVWVVVGVSSQAATAYDAGMTWAYTFQAKVNGEWLALDLVDSGCRLDRKRALAVS